MMKTKPHTYHSKFQIGDRVSIDGCSELKAIVTAFTWRNEKALCEVSWVSGDAKTAWIEEWRMTVLP